MDRQSIRWMTLLLGVVVVAAGWSLFDSAKGTGQFLGYFSTPWAVLLGGYGLFTLVALALLSWAYRNPDRVSDLLFQRLDRSIQKLGIFRWVVFAALIIFQSWLLLGPIGDRLTPFPLRLLIFSALAFAGAALLPVSFGPFPIRWVLALMVLGVGFFAGKELNLVRSYPFKLTWSEGNRIWDYSLYFGQNRYDLHGELDFPSYMAPGRHGLWGLAFLVPGLQIWGARLWNAILWILPGLLLAWALLRRLPKNVTQRIGIGWVLWVFLFLSQGPIYAPLILAAVLVAWGYDADRPFRSGAVVALACFYAGTSRWTWMATPALWGGLWVVLDSDRSQVWWRRALWPVGLGLVGLAGGWLSQVAVDAIHPSDGPVFATSFSQALLWYRLFPSATNPLGILPGVALATGPLLALMILAWRRRWFSLDWLEALAVVAVLVSTFAVGLIASVKIGGGNNLHNLDMFLVSLVFTSALLLRRVNLEAVTGQIGRAAWLISALIFLIPVGFNLQGGAPLHLPEQEVIETSLAQIQDFIDQASLEGEVLFIDQRQLLTFGQVSVPLIEDYELKDLTNLSMIGDPQLFSDFYADLRSGRFSVIVTGHLPNQWRGRGHPFGEEDDAQLEFIYLPLQEYYHPALQLDEVGIWLLVPTMTDHQSFNAQGESVE